MDQMDQMCKMGQIDKMGQIGKMDQMDHMNQMDQMDHMNQMDQIREAFFGYFPKFVHMPRYLLDFHAGKLEILYNYEKHT